MMESGCVEVDDQVNSDLFKIMDKNTERVKSDFAENSFRRLFWEQQLKSTKIKDPLPSSLPVTQKTAARQDLKSKPRPLHQDFTLCP